jgi:hypothetical protein
LKSNPFGADKEREMTAPMNYVDPPDVPEGMTLAEYRRTRPAGRPSRRRGLARLRRRRAEGAARPVRQQPADAA